MILRPAEVVPDEHNLLNLQAEFVTRIHPMLLPLYVVGAFLTMLGTLYGTIEIACAIADEIVRSFFAHWTERSAKRLRRIVLGWCGPLALGILVWLFVRQASPVEPTAADIASVTATVSTERDDTSARAASASSAASVSDEPARRNKPRVLLAILTPVNLFTGVLACGLICFVVIWMDRRWLPPTLQPPIWLTAMNLISAAVFFGLGLKGYWDNENRLIVVCCMVGIFVLAMIVAVVGETKLRPRYANQASTNGDQEK
jgi:hypothetical protein